MSRWFRFYNCVVNDPKVQRLPAEKFKDWVNLLCIASENNGVLPSLEDIAFTLRKSEEEVAAILDDFRERGLFDPVEASYEPHNWDKRQFKSDQDSTAAERAKRYRDRKNKERSPEQVENVASRVTSRDDHASRTETDTDTDTEQSISRAPDPLPSRAGDFRQAVVSAYAEANSPTVPDTARCELWLSQGYDPEICLAVVKTVVKRKPNASLAYFDQPIAEAHTQRAPPRLKLIEPPKYDWEAAAKLWKAVRRWPKGHGNDPDSVSCMCPREILQKHGIAGAA